MIDKIVAAFVENAWLIVVMFLAFGFYAFLQAGITMLRDWFLVKVFHKKMNGNGKNANGGMTKEQGDELIRHIKSNGVTQTGMKTAIELMGGRVGEIHDIVCEKDGDNFPKMRVMEKKVREIWNKVIRGEA